MIRKIEPEEINDVLIVWINASIQAHSFIDEEFWKSKMVDMRETYIPNSETYIYKENEIIKGFFSLQGNTLAAMFVSIEFQSNGIGRKMMEKAKTLGKILELTVYKENQKGIAFYKNCGFKIIKEKVDIHTGHIEILMNYGC